MSILYESPQAFDGSVAEAYGKLQQENLRAEHSLKQAEASARARAADQANANDVSRMNAQVNVAEMEGQLRSGIETARNQTGVEEANIREQGQQQRQANEFNYADGIRLQNLQQQRTMIDSDPNLGDDEKQQLRQMIDPNISALSFRQKQTQIQLEQQQVRRVATQTAHQDGLDAIRRQQVGQTGTAGHYRLPDPNDPSGQTFLPGVYQRNRHGETELVPGTAGGGGRSGTGGAGAPGQIPPQITAAIDHATRTIDRALESQTNPLPEDHPYRTNRAQAIMNLAREHRAAAEALTSEDRDIRSRLAYGPMPFDVPPTNAADVYGVVANAMQRTVNDSITAAEARNAPRESERLRAIAGDLNDGKTTGDLAPEQQRELQRIGYYGRHFTPTIDRQISSAIQKPPEVVNQGGQRVVVRQQPTPEMQEAASNLRTLLAAYDGPPPATQPMARQRFDELRGRLGFTQWPPPLSRHSDQPPRPPVTNRPTISPQRTGTPSDSAEDLFAPGSAF